MAEVRLGIERGSGQWEVGLVPIFYLRPKLNAEDVNGRSGWLVQDITGSGYCLGYRGRQAMAGKESLLTELVAPVAAALGYEFWGLEYQSHGHTGTVRIYIDSAQGITVDDCAKMSRQVSSVFDVEDPIMGEYNLEVSSPGMDRPLFTLEQYRRHVGEQVKIRLRSPYEGRRKFTGVLTGVEDDDVVIAIGDDEYLLPFDLIDKANVVPTF